jgi:hypothetical protein
MIMPSVIMMIVVMLSVVAPKRSLRHLGTIIDIQVCELMCKGTKGQILSSFDANNKVPRGCSGSI